MNDSQADAYELTGPCSAGQVSNVGAATTPAADDPLNTVYALGGTFSRQVWWKMENSTGDQAYARFVLTNISADPIDIAAAVYLDDPAATPRPQVRSAGDDAPVTWQVSLDSGATVTVGTGIPNGSTVWLEIAGDDTEGDGQGWDGNLQLGWQMLAATFYDTPDDGFEGLTEWVGDLASSSGVLVHSYCKLGDQHFAAVSTGGFNTAEVWVWTEGGGAPTVYTLPNAFEPGIYSSSSISPAYGNGTPLLRTDGTSVWFVAYVRTTTDGPCIGHPDPINVISPGVWIYTGSGWTYLGSDPPQTFSFTSYHQAVGTLTAAASSAETGVLHVMWSEAGVAIGAVDPVTCAIEGWGFRVGYAKWNTTSLVTSGATVISGDGSTPTPSDPVLSQYLWVTNAYGSPIAFWGASTGIDLTDVSPTGAVPYGSVITMWSIDETTGAPTVLQTFDGATHGASLLLVEGVFAALIGGTRLPPQDTYGGADTIFFAAQWGAGGGSASFIPLLAVPADGSSAIVLASPQTANGLAILDAYDDSRNLWVNEDGEDVNGSSLTCPDGTSSYTTDGTRLMTDVEMQYEASPDAFYTLGHTSTDYAPMKIPVLRDYLICSVSPCPGLFIWSRV